MWNWREYYHLVEQIRKYTRVLYSGESLVQIPQEESIGEPFLLHTISGIYYGDEKKSSFCGYDTEKTATGRMVWLYLKRMPGSGQTLFNAVFLRYGGKKQGERRRNHGIRMVYWRIAESAGKLEKEKIPKEEQEGKAEIFSVDDSFRKLVIIGKEEMELRKATLMEFLDIFGKAADEHGMLLLVEQNARILYHENGTGEKLHQYMG